MNWRNVRSRAYADFCMPSRLSEYRELLEFALREGYKIRSLREFRRELCGGLRPEIRYCVLRHDVDTGVRTAQRMWDIEQRLSINGSYYFRLQTLEVGFMQAIERAGGEASYHFEELSTVAKLKRVRHRDEVHTILPVARELFARNIQTLRQRTGLRMEIVAGHGDWLNKRLGVQNTEVLASDAFRREVQVELEAYDASLMQAVLKHSDAPYPGRWLWQDRDPLESIRTGIPAIQLLVHPRHWQVERSENLIVNVSRCAEELWYRLG